MLEKAVEEFSKLPGIGRKTALRLVLHLIKLDEGVVDNFAKSVVDLRHGVKHCRICHNICDNDICGICSDSMRDGTTVCVVENFQDVLAIESTSIYHGLYHVLGGAISPMDGIAPSDLEIESLVERVRNHPIKEIILALSSTMEGDTTNFYIFRRLSEFKDLQVTMLARGISVNDELQYTDEVTLGRSLVNRVPFSSQ